MNVPLPFTVEEWTSKSLFEQGEILYKRSMQTNDVKVLRETIKEIQLLIRLQEEIMEMTE